MTTKLVAESVVYYSSSDIQQVADLAGYVKWILVSRVGRNCCGCQTRSVET